MSSTMTHHLYSPPALDHPLTRHSNTAGAPLPLIPRRVPSAGRSQLSRHAHSHPETAIKVHPPTPPKDSTASTVVPEDSDASTSSVSDEHWPTILPRSKRPVGGLLLVGPPESPTPATTTTTAGTASQTRSSSSSSSSTHKTDESASYNAPSSRRPSLVQRASDPSPPPLHHSALHTPAFCDNPTTLQPPIEIPLSVQAKLIRKKSGQPVKSSLKSTKSQDRGSLSIITAGLSSKSAPATPTTHAKAVHFDSRLEHVKLFLAEQKPLAVSRDGSPTTDTSGTDNDFPSFIYGGGGGEDSVRETCEMQVINMPPEVDLSADVVLAELRLSQDTMTIIGDVRVRNIAYQKWIAVRFTFDSWQTVSEVTARHSRAVQGGAFDMFTFSIRLNDLLARIDDKTLILALRYTVGGREIWDNNAGQNYVARFTKTKQKSATGVVELQNKLEIVVNGKEGLLASVEPSQSDKPPGFKEASLSSRYNLTASFKNSWKPPTLPASSHWDSGDASSRNSIPWPLKAAPPKSHWKPFTSSQKKMSDVLGSPREKITDDYFRPDVEDFSLHHRAGGHTGRNHQRSVFSTAFCDAGNLRRTPPGSPLVKSSTENNVPRSSSGLASHQALAPADNMFLCPVGWRRDGGGSEESTPSIVSPSSSSRSASPSPTEAEMDRHLGRQLPADSPIGYSQFLDKFCFYTGSENVPDHDEASRVATRSLSVDTLPSSPTAAAHFADRRFSACLTPTRTQSFDEIVYRSGSSTPTPRTSAHHHHQRIST